MHYIKKYSPTPAAASIRMLLVTAATKDGELCNFVVKQEFLKVVIDEDIYIRIPEEYQEFPGGSGVTEQGDIWARTGGKVLENQVLRQHDSDQV